MTTKKSSRKPVSKDGAGKPPRKDRCEGPGAPDPYLGHARAVVIACTCANTIPANLPRTLAELGVNGIPFQQCVRTSVTTAGYAIGADDIPSAPGTRLIHVVTVIQNAPRQPDQTRLIS
jgi:hypothetical protein